MGETKVVNPGLVLPTAKSCMLYLVVDTETPCFSSSYLEVRPTVNWYRLWTAKESFITKPGTPSLFPLHGHAGWSPNKLWRILAEHDDVIKWKHFPRYWPFVWGIHRSPVNSQHKGQWRGALMFSLICVGINGWMNNRESGDLRRYRTHYDARVDVICHRCP